MPSLIKKVIVTEKSSLNQGMGKYTLQVTKDATKPEIKKALKLLYKVDAISVRTVTEQPIRRRYRGRLKLKQGSKKAIVTLKEGQKIDIT